MLWIGLVLQVPDRIWDMGVSFWSGVTGTRGSTTTGNTPDMLALVPPEGATWLAMRRAPDSRPGLWLRLDTDRPGEVTRTALQAGAVCTRTTATATSVLSPGGLPFDISATPLTRAPRMGRTSRGDIPDQVCLDISAAAWQREVEFWRLLTGRVVETGLCPEFAFLGDPDPAGPARILLQRLGSPAPTVTAHLDLATADRERSVAQHERFGAVIGTVHPAWTVMTAPTGHIYCLTDRDPTTGRVQRAHRSAQ